MTIFRIHALYNQQEPNAHTVDYAHRPDYVKAVYLTGSVFVANKGKVLVKIHFPRKKAENDRKEIHERSIFKGLVWNH